MSETAEYCSFKSTEFCNFQMAKIDGGPSISLLRTRSTGGRATSCASLWGCYEDIASFSKSQAFFSKSHALARLLHSHTAALKTTKRQGILSHSERHHVSEAAFFLALGLSLDQRRPRSDRVERLLPLLLRFFFVLRFVIWVLLY
ncbi:hypothetical protein HFK18_13535|uniref:hypothetical protein n=1 Tax=Stenotrophomonas sp. SbOxS2 TaxID=2723885 RepID=UPI0015D33981|nr:hypothetical protein [Stenotrophomonas sp. SbOxS2]NYT99492.1 hypothetical protein [Stenotrophomonas sp. SbOxS2]